MVNTLNSFAFQEPVVKGGVNEVTPNPPTVVPNATLSDTWKRYHHEDEFVMQNLSTGEVVKFKQGDEGQMGAMEAFMEGKDVVYD